MLKPKITYNDGTARTLNPTFPPVMKSAVPEHDAQRFDTATLSGRVQSLWFRTDRYFTLQMDYVPGSDVAAWDQFITHAEKGKVFTYYPDDTDSGTHNDYTMVDTNWLPEWSSRGATGIYKFKLKMRRYVA